MFSEKNIFLHSTLFLEAPAFNTKKHRARKNNAEFTLNHIHHKKIVNTNNAQVKYKLLVEKFFFLHVILEYFIFLKSYNVMKKSC